MVFFVFKERHKENSITGKVDISIFVVFLASYTSAWLIVAVTVERWGAVTLPHKAKVLFTRKRSYIAVAAIAMFFIVFDIPYLLTFGILKIPVPNVDSLSNTTSVELSSNSTLATEGGLEKTINVCAPDKYYILFPYTGWMAYGLAAYNLVPFVFLMVGNITIIKVITRASLARKMMSSRGKPCWM